MRATPVALVFVASALAASGGLLAQVHGPPRTPGPFMDVADVRPGMRGYGLTVFQGVRPARFEVEVIDVVHNFRPHQDLVLIRPHHPTLDPIGTVAGMSGSPIYLNDRLLGAYAYGWEFGRDAVAGVTPIAPMMAELRRPRRAPPGLLPTDHLQIPIGEPAQPVAPSGGASADTDGAPAGLWQSLTRRAVASREAVQTAYGALVPLATPLTVAGASTRAVAHLADSLAPFGLMPVQAAGGAQGPIAADTPTQYEPGSAVAVQLIAGDISANVTGTVTHVTPEGDLVAFGHPMTGMGETSLPAALARVMWILASERRSMKIAEPVRPIGALIQDRPSGIVVRESAVAPTVPIRVRVHGVDGAPHDDWHTTVANHRALLGRLMGTVVETALDETAGDQGDVAWTVRSRIALHNRPTVEFTEHGTGSEGVHGVGTLDATLFVQRMMDNAFGVAQVDGVDVDVDLHWARDVAWVRSVALTREEIDPGQSVDLRVALGRYGHATEYRTVTVAVPRELAGREVDLEVSAGGETVADLPEPESLDDLVRNLTTHYPDDAVVVTLRMPGQGVTVRGRVVPNLPGSALDTLRPAASTDSGDPLLNLRRMVVPVGRVVVGRDHVRLRVREVRL